MLMRSHTLWKLQIGGVHFWDTVVGIQTAYLSTKDCAVMLDEDICERIVIMLYQLAGVEYHTH